MKWFVFVIGGAMASMVSANEPASGAAEAPSAVIEPAAPAATAPVVESTVVSVEATTPAPTPAPVAASEPAAAPEAAPAPATAATPEPTAVPEAVAAPTPAPTPAPVVLPAPVAVPALTPEAAAMLPPEAREEIILNNPANLQALKTLLGPELFQPAPQPVTAGMQTVAIVAAPSAAMMAGRQQVQVRPGETLDRILARTLGRTPFAPALVRRTVVEMNPTAFVGGSPHRLNAGATLVLPSLQDLQAVAGGTATGAALIHSGPGGGVHGGHMQDDRRNWIRYP